MKKEKRSINLIAILIAVLMIGFYCVSAIAEDLRVGVYSGMGQKGILAGLKKVEGIKATPLKNFSVSSLSNCEAVVWPWGRLALSDRTRPWRVLLTEYVKAGGGLILTHDAAGGAGKRRGDMGEHPLFGDIARCPGYAKRKEKTVLIKVSGVDHPLAKALPDKLTHAYYDHMALITGLKGTTIMTDEDGDPVVVAGRIGKGYVVMMGNLPGYKGTKKRMSSGLSKVADEGTAALAGDELALMAEAVKWAGKPLQNNPIPPARLETFLKAAVDKAVIGADQVEEEVIKVFSTAASSRRLDPSIWEYARKGPSANKFGTWYGSGPSNNRHLEALTANQPITTKRFEKSPVKGKFLFTGEAILTSYYGGILEWRIIDETANKDIQDGYGIRLVHGGLEKDPRTGEKPATGYALRATRKSYKVKIGKVRHAILKITRGRATELAVVETPGKLMSPAKGLQRVPIRFERTADGVMLLSIDGLVVARTTDNAYNTFTKLRAIMTTPGGRLGFGHPKLLGYFVKEKETHVPAPWIVPEPKEMKKTGKTFVLTDGAQFVVADKKKIDTYLLDEWIIPEIEGRYGISMKAVTIEEMDKSKPAIYLGEGNDPAFARIFNKALKAISKEDPGPASGEGYMIRANAKKIYAVGAGTRGTFYALQSLVQLIARDGDSIGFRCANIKDWPDIQLRGSFSSLWSRRDRIQSNMERALTCVRMFARYKVNAFIIGGKFIDFPSYNLSGYGCQWSFKDLSDIYKLCEKYHIEVIPCGWSLCHAALRVDFYLSRKNPKLWKWIVDNKILADDLSNKHEHSKDSFNAMNPLAWEMCKKLNQDFINISPNSRFFVCPFDEINPPIHTYAPKGTEDDLLEEWILKLHKHMKENGKRMMMFPSYLTEAAKFPGSSASLGRTGGEGMPVHDLIDRIPKDIIMADWYYGTSPDRAIYKHLRDKGFDVIAVPGANYGYPYESAYYAAVEGKKAGVMGLLAFGFDFGAYVNPSYIDYSLPWIYGWTVPDKMKPGWAWQERWQDVFQGPLPSHTGKVIPVDISAVCNESRIDDKSDDGIGWLDYGKFSDLRKLPDGELSYRQYRFNIIDEAKTKGKSVIVVFGRKGKKDSAGSKVTDIPVGSKAKSLVFLHAATSLGAIYFSDSCAYRILYEDGKDVSLPVKYGHQMGPWIYTTDVGSPRLNCYYNYGYLSWCRLLKTGRTAMGEKTGLYAYEWVNPYPEKKIASIDMEVNIDRDIRVALVALSIVN